MGKKPENPIKSRLIMYGIPSSLPTNYAQESEDIRRLREELANQTPVFTQRTVIRTPQDRQVLEVVQRLMQKKS